MEIKGERKGDNGFLREHNRTLVVNILRRSGPLSRAELSRRTGLAPSALSRLSAELLDLGILQEVGKAEVPVGRPPILLGLNPDYAHSIGVKVEKGRVLAARIDLFGRVRQSISFPFPDPAPQTVLGAIKEAFLGLRTERTMGLGIAVSGFVDSMAGECLFSPILGWRDVPLKAFLEGELGVEVHVENDVNALTLAEARYGAGRGLSDFACVTVGEGLGAGIVIGGKLYRGAFGGAGEFGHTLFQAQGPRCRCGERGCLELFASDQFLLRRARERGFSGIEELSSRAKEGDAIALGIYRELGVNLGLGLKDLVNLLNPQAILIGGERTQADGDLFLPVAEEVVRRHAFVGAGRRVRLLRTALGEEGFLVGAAAVFVERFFRRPLEVRR